MTDWKLYLVAMFGAICFISGAIMEHKRNSVDYEFMSRISQEACDMRIKTLKATCKK